MSGLVTGWKNTRVRGGYRSDALDKSIRTVDDQSSGSYTRPSRQGHSALGHVLACARYLGVPSLPVLSSSGHPNGAIWGFYVTSDHYNRRIEPLNPRKTRKELPWLTTAYHYVAPHFVPILGTGGAGRRGTPFEQSRRNKPGEVN